MEIPSTPPTSSRKRLITICASTGGHHHQQATTDATVRLSKRRQMSRCALLWQLSRQAQPNMTVLRLAGVVTLFR